MEGGGEGAVASPSLSVQQFRGANEMATRKQLLRGVQVKLKGGDKWE